MPNISATKKKAAKTSRVSGARYTTKSIVNTAARNWNPVKLGSGSRRLSPRRKRMKKSENGRRDDCGSLEKRLAVNLVLCVEDGQHHQVQHRESAGEQEPAEPKALVDLVPCQ